MRRERGRRWSVPAATGRGAGRGDEAARAEPACCDHGTRDERGDRRGPNARLVDALFGARRFRFGRRSCSRAQLRRA